jgi:hypothetical protein
VCGGAIYMRSAWFGMDGWSLNYLRWCTEILVPRLAYSCSMWAKTSGGSPPSSANPAFRYPRVVAAALQRYYSNSSDTTLPRIHIGRARCTPAPRTIRCVAPGYLNGVHTLRLVWLVTKVDSRTASVTGELFNATTGVRYSTSGLPSILRAAWVGLKSW